MSKDKDKKDKDAKRWKPDERPEEEKVSTLLDAFETALNEAKEREGLSFGMEVNKAKRTLKVDLVPEDKKDVVSGDITLTVPTAITVKLAEGKDKKYGLEFFDIIGSNSKVSIAKVYKDRVRLKTKRTVAKVVERVIPFVRSNGAAVREEIEKLAPALEQVAGSTSEATQSMSFIPELRTLKGTTSRNGANITRTFNVATGEFTGVDIAGNINAETIKAIEALL